MTLHPSTLPFDHLPDTESLMPVFFIGHGTPMNAVETNRFSSSWAMAAQTVTSPPTAIVCISAHWQTHGSRVTAMERPRTIHDFYGFPQPLYDVSYPAPGSPALAEFLCRTVTPQPLIPDLDWGLDHGTWSVLIQMFPNASIPVVQLSLDLDKDPEAHHELGKNLAELRKKKVLIVCSGNCVHNLQTLTWDDTAFAWAREVDEAIKEAILNNQITRLIRYKTLHRSASLAIPTNEHYLPMLYALALRNENDPLEFFAEQVTLGSISMRSFRIG